ATQSGDESPHSKALRAERELLPREAVFSCALLAFASALDSRGGSAIVIRATVTMRQLVQKVRTILPCPPAVALAFVGCALLAPDPVAMAQRSRPAVQDWRIGSSSGFSSDVEDPVHRVFFPPNPPPLGVGVVVPRGSAPARSDAPAMLSQYVGEPFYAPLSARLAARKMKPEMTDAVAEYVKLRAGFLRELREHVYGIQEADTATRMRMNAALAREQAPGLSALAAAADRLRRELYRDRRFGEYEFDWNAKRKWKLGASALDRPREENAVLEYQVQRAAVFFQDGLVPAQRRLLREVVMEMEDEVFRPDSQPMSAYGFVFFSPETARVRMPSNLPEGAAVRLESFVREKEALKAAIRDAIYAADSRKLISSRARAMEELARAQEPRLAELDELAEEIRRELVDVPELQRPSAPDPLPERIEEMVSEFQRDRGALQARLGAAVRAAHAAVEPPASRAPADLADYQDRLSAAAGRASSEFERENAAAVSALQSDMEAIVAAVEKYIPENDEALLAGSAEAIVTRFLTRQRQRESNFEYHTAVLEPGLSPEQRRLLFGAAIRRMELPLPGSEPQPTLLPGTLLPVEEVGR
ncbi:MAG: hypothetical protein ACREIA_07340, partial [Opitutaceae bacterium]